MIAPAHSEPKLAVAYLRVSGQAQVQGDGFPRQRDAIQRFADTHGYTLIGEYFEDISGKVECADRADFARMIVDLEEQPATVICERADRFARSMIAGEVSIDMCRQRSIQVIGADTGMDLTQTVDPMMDAFRQMQFLFAELERKMLVAKLRAARERRKAIHGKCEGAKCFGEYFNEKETHELILSLRHLGPSKLARRLYELGIPARKGGTWHPGVISRILNRKTK